MVTPLNPHIHHFEFKMVEFAPECTATEQRKTKDYATKYSHISRTHPIDWDRIQQGKSQYRQV